MLFRFIVHADPRSRSTSWFTLVPFKRSSFLPGIRNGIDIVAAIVIIMPRRRISTDFSIWIYTHREWSTITFFYPYFSFHPVCTFFDLLLYYNYSFKGCEYNNLRVENVLFSFFTLMGIICWELWNRSSNNNKLHSQRNKSGKNYFQTHTPLTLALLTKRSWRRGIYFSKVGETWWW